MHELFLKLFHYNNVLISLGDYALKQVSITNLLAELLSDPQLFSHQGIHRATRHIYEQLIQQGTNLSCLSTALYFNCGVDVDFIGPIK